MLSIIAILQIKIMRRRFENINTVAGGKIPVFACKILAPTTALRNPVPILSCRDRFNGVAMAAYYVLDRINNKVCTMGGNPINCTISNSGQYIRAYFNEGSVTGDIILQFTIVDVLYYFFITEDSDQVPQLELSPSTYLIHSIYKISGSFIPIDTYIAL